MKSKYVYGLIIFIIGLICGLVISQSLIKKKAAQPQSAANNQVSININAKPTDQAYPWLDFPVEYFSMKDVQWGSAGKGDTGKISDYTQVSLKNKAVYQSYPTTTITIKDYSNEIQSLKTKSFSEVMQEHSKTDPGWGDQIIKDNYQKYGNLATNYLPTNSIWGLDKFDVDEDGLAETVVMYNFVGSADGGSYRSDIIKDNNIIFSVQEDNANIVPADTTNGFYIEWGSVGAFTGRCCEEGQMRTRFVFKDGKFTPIYEQEVMYLKVGKE